MVDGVHFGEHTCVVALGIGIDGTKHPLPLVQGSTENTTLVTELIVGLRERGLDVTKPILVVLDGSKALRRAGHRADQGRRRPAESTPIREATGVPRWPRAGPPQPAGYQTRGHPPLH
jgi:hypothetical protein